MKIPDTNTIFPLVNYKNLCFFKKHVNNLNINIGNYTYYDDFEDISNFEQNVKYHFNFIGDKLIAGKFCMIASGVQFVMNSGKHLKEFISAYAFAIFGGTWQDVMKNKKYPSKSDIIIGNDIWVGLGVTTLPGVTIGDGAIIASKSVVTKKVELYTIVSGNPVIVIQKRFNDDKIDDLLNLKWWNWDIEKITANVQILTGNNFSRLKN